MAKNNYASWYNDEDKEICCPYLVEATPVDWVDLEKAKEYPSLQDYDEETDELECEMQEYFPSILEAKKYIQANFESGTFVKAYICDEREDFEIIFGTVYNEDWFDKNK